MSQIQRPVIITALPIAFERNGELSVDGTQQIFKKVADSGVDGALALGTTGEFVSLSFEERGLLTALAVQELSKMRCIVHVGAGSSYEVVKLIKQARSAGVTELALLTPYYLLATDSEMLSFFSAAAEASPGMDIYVYAFRDRTGNAVGNELMRDLAQIPNIVGAKVSGERAERLSEYREVVPDSFILYTGGDSDLARVAQLGAQGVVSGNAAVLPRPFTRLAELVASGTSAGELVQAQAAVDDVTDVIQGDMARMKAALRLQGIDAGYPRMAISEPDESALSEIHRVVEAYGEVPVH